MLRKRGRPHRGEEVPKRAPPPLRALPDAADRFEQESQILEDELQPLLTDAFLAVLVQAARTCGWPMRNWNAVSFVHWCFAVADKPCPVLTPFVDP